MKYKSHELIMYRCSPEAKDKVLESSNTSSFSPLKCTSDRHNFTPEGHKYFANSTIYWYITQTVSSHKSLLFAIQALLRP